GKASGALGFGSGSGFVSLRPAAGGRTRLEDRYEASIGGKVATVGQRMLGSVMRYLIAQFFHSLERRIRPASRLGWLSWWSRLRDGRRGGEALKPVAFDYYRPQALAEAVALLSDMGDEAAILAGGMTLGPMLNLRVSRPRAVIDISRMSVLKTISVQSSVVLTGAGVTQSDALGS